MPITSKVDKENSLTIFTLSEELKLDDIQNAIKSFWEAHEMTMNALWDARNAELTRIKSSDMESVAAVIGQYTHRFEERKNGKTAVVASSDLQYGLSRILKTFYETENFPVQLKIFRNKDEAVEWLDQEE